MCPLFSAGCFLICVFLHTFIVALFLVSSSFRHSLQAINKFASLTDGCEFDPSWNSKTEMIPTVHVWGEIASWLSCRRCADITHASLNIGHNWQHFRRGAVWELSVSSILNHDCKLNELIILIISGALWEQVENVFCGM